MSAHLPGPWRVSEMNNGFIFVKHDSNAHGPLVVTVAWVVVREGCYVEGEANARLIAAAPDLLAACRAMVECCGSSENWNGETRHALSVIEAAIAKAEGRP